MDKKFIASVTKKLNNIEFSVGVFKDSNNRKLAGKGTKNLTKGVVARKTSSKSAGVGNADVLANQKVDVLNESFKKAKPRLIQQITDLMIRQKVEPSGANVKRAENGVASIPRTFLTTGGISKRGSKVGGVDTGQMYLSIKAKAIK